MRAKEKEQIAELRTHIIYIRENVKEMRKKVDKLEKRGEEIEAIRTNLENHLQMHKEDWAKVGLFVAIMTTIVSWILKWVGVL